MEKAITEYEKKNRDNPQRKIWSKATKWAEDPEVAHKKSRGQIAIARILERGRRRKEAKMGIRKILEKKAKKKSGGRRGLPERA